MIVDKDRRLLVITHSDRPVDAARCHLNFLQQRYERQDRLPPKEKFLDLGVIPPELEGTITIWDISNILKDGSRPTLISRYRTAKFKPQHAMWFQDHLWVLGTERLEVLDRSLELEKTITDPWMSGTHTLNVDPQGNLIVSCSGSDSVLIVDPKQGKVIAAHRLPESIYGLNYPLQRSDSVVKHFIHNDVQLTHINCASPWKNGIVISTLIQGALGWFDSDFHYQELTRGFVGCHGVRANTQGQLYFCDSCLGALCFLDEKYRVQRRFDANSIWLHDGLQITDSIYALAVADRNAVEFIDIKRWQTIYSIDGSQHGKTVQFLYYGN